MFVIIATRDRIFHLFRCFFFSTLWFNIARCSFTASFTTTFYIQIFDSVYIYFRLDKIRRNNIYTHKCYAFKMLHSDRSMKHGCVSAEHFSFASQIQFQRRKSESKNETSAFRTHLQWQIAPTKHLIASIQMRFVCTSAERSEPHSQTKQNRFHKLNSILTAAA